MVLPLVLLAFAVQAGPVDELAERWAKSPHADAAAEAFTHWDEDGEIPGACATCHSGKGFVDFINSDGNEAGMLDHSVAIGSLIDCQTCHNKTAGELNAVKFPSGVTMSGLDSSARCIVCHQGRESTIGVNRAVTDLDDDTVSADLGFLNVHYRAAAATETIRTTKEDLDGDGDTSEGIVGEIATMHGALLRAIADYAASVAGTAVIYDSHAYPYFFADTNANGVSDEGEAIFPNRYQSWTPRLLRAAYNYQFVAKDTGAFAHNPHYVAQIIYDSLESLAARTDIDMAQMVRP
ncbi:MAG: cytochrome c3 family protein [Alphaproteobacteria bacterium]